MKQIDRYKTYQTDLYMLYVLAKLERIVDDIKPNTEGFLVLLFVFLSSIQFNMRYLSYVLILTNEPAHEFTEDEKCHNLMSCLKCQYYANIII